MNQEIKKYNHICEICEFRGRGATSLSKHLLKMHNMSTKEYYDLFYRNYRLDEGICPICNKETAFYNIKIGYMKTCSLSCASKRAMPNETKNKIGNSNKKKSSGAFIKRKITCNDKYGVDNIYQAKGIKNKIKETILNNFGLDNPMKSDEIKGDMKDRYFSKHGVDYPWQNPNIREKISKIRFKKTYMDRILNMRDIKPLFSLDDFTGVGYYDKKYKFQCLLCGSIFEDTLYSNDPRCQKCHPKFNTGSKMEYELFNWLTNIIDDVVHNKRFQHDSSEYEIDIFIPSKKIGVELDGIYWHSELRQSNRHYHRDKTDWFKKNFDIDILHVFESEWILKNDIVKSIILNVIGKTPNKIYARKCDLKEITSSEYRKFLNENHIQGAMNSPIRFGLFYKDRLVSVVGFGKSRFKLNEFELHRFCSCLNTSIIGGFSKLIKGSNINNFITYCDRRFFTASGYKKIGFEFIEFTNPNYFYFKNNDYTLYNRINFQKHKLRDKLDCFNPELTEWQNMVNNGWNRIWDCGNIKLRYVK